MSSGRLQQQFIRLWQCCDGKSQETTLNELAEMLSCSRRHMRTLLNMMESRGWLTWEAEAGRGKRSRLTFLYTGLALQQQRAEDLLEQDRIDQLVQLVGDKAAVRQMLVSHLGRSFRQGRHILRVLYYRPMKNLLPGSALRRSETHIARQIFSALTRVNEENGELEADIAHHWQQLSPTHWRFFLRPGIHFHHGRELEMADVIASLQRSNALPLYSHIERIESPTAWTLDIHLRQPDRWLPWLLGQVPAMVLPQEWQTMNHFSSMPVGTGPYAVVRNNQNQLKIHAFEDYFGYRALIDEVNVWVLPEISEEPNGGLTLQGNTESEKAVESRLEEGCYYLLVRLAKPAGGQRRGAPLAKLSVSARQPALPCGRTLPGQLVSRLRPAAALASRQQPRLREAGGAGDSHPYLLPRSRRTSGDRRDHARPAGGASGKAGDPGAGVRCLASRRGGQRYLAQQRELHLTDRIFALRLSVRSPADSALHSH